MIPDEVRAQLQPALAAPGEDVPRVTLPCGLALKFVLNEETVTWAEFGRWRVSIQAAGEVAGMNAITYIQWEEVEAGIFENDDSCWPEMVLAPATFVEHNYVPGHPVVYIVGAQGDSHWLRLRGGFGAYPAGHAGWDSDLPDGPERGPQDVVTVLRPRSHGL